MMTLSCDFSAGDRDCVSADPSTGAVGDKTVGLITDWIWTWNYISGEHPFNMNSLLTIGERYCSFNGTFTRYIT